jgi:hypothetical protein
LYQRQYQNGIWRIMGGTIMTCTRKCSYGHDFLILTGKMCLLMFIS